MSLPAHVGYWPVVVSFSESPSIRRDEEKWNKDAKNKIITNIRSHNITIEHLKDQKRMPRYFTR